MPDISGNLRWVGCNVDKPHRCPSCHRVCAWGKDKYGPRTRMSCAACRLQWRAGCRATRLPRRIRLAYKEPLR